MATEITNPTNKKTHAAGQWANVSSDHVSNKIAKAFPDEGQREVALRFLADMINVANDLNPRNWVLTLGRGRALRLISGRPFVVELVNNHVTVFATRSVLPPDLKDYLLENFTAAWQFKMYPDGLILDLPGSKLPELLPAVREAVIATIRMTAASTYRSAFAASYVPSAISFLDDRLSTKLPRPDVSQAEKMQFWKISTQGLGQVVDRLLKSEIVALDFDRATFDIRDAQPNSASDVQAEFANHGVTIDLAPNHAPAQLWAFLDTVKVGDRVYLTYGGMIRGAGFVTGEYQFGEESETFQHQRAVKWELIKIPIASLPTQVASTLQTAYKTLQQLDASEGMEIERIISEVEFGDDEWHSAYRTVFSRAKLTYSAWQQAVFFTALQTKGFVILSGISGTGKTKIAQAFAAALPQSDDGSRNVEFLTVRPDWRDSKSLIGYHNPLTDRYEWTPFLRFLLRACQSWEERDGLAWFVILDEMNLAHVEHYFAEMLSIIESGRDDDGWSRESIAIPSTGGEGSPPASIKLPPNLHIIGTVNLDDTTHAFSPKVLDRAFALEFSDVSFIDYLKPGAATASEPDPLDASDILNALSSDGSFPRVDKAALAATLATDDRPRVWLESLNRRLRPHHLHFGFRVFDEVVAFVSYGMSNGLFLGMPPNGDEVTAAFDAAAMMKILPKFHGSRSRLDMPLKIVLAWCLNPTFPDLETIQACIAKTNSPQEMELALLALPFHFPKTAERTIRLLWTAHVEGFAAFG
ncbi:hypothetical protein BH09CHL1_BH09CHL1_18880 [soil metagenome]